MERHLFMFGDADEELLLALAIGVEQSNKDTGHNMPAVTAADLWELLEEPSAVHTSLRSEWPSERRLVLALRRLRKRKLVTRRRYSEGALCWDVTDGGYDLLGERLIFEPERPRRPHAA
jgi:hypothetical protein